MSSDVWEPNLARRGIVFAALVGGLGCSANGTSQGVASPRVVATPALSPSSDSGPPAPANELRISPDLPSLATPQGVSDATRRHYEALARRVIAAHHLMDTIKIPDCAVKACEARWRTLAEKLYQAGQAYTFACQGSSEEARAYAEIESVHMKFLMDRVIELDTRASDAAMPGSDRSGLDRLIEIEREVYDSHATNHDATCEDW